jgi:hypothetical protein
LLAHGWWFSPGTPASSTTRTDRHDIAEILLKVALKPQKLIIFSFHEHLLSIIKQKYILVWVFISHLHHHIVSTTISLGITMYQSCTNQFYWLWVWTEMNKLCMMWTNPYRFISCVSISNESILFCPFIYISK